MIQLTGYLDIPEDRFQAVMAALPQHIALTRAEPGNLTFHVTESATIPRRLEVDETFVDRPAFEFHGQRASKTQWAEVTKGIPRHFQIQDIPD